MKAKILTNDKGAWLKMGKNTRQKTENVKTP
jgi:hypothetical protein